MNENDDLYYMLGEGKKWKNKYKVTWCDLCNCAIIICPECKNSSCNCSSCDKCYDDFGEFYKCKVNVSNYVTEEEFKVYSKCLSIKRHILESLREGEKEINWKNLKKLGKLSRNDEEIFKNELI